MKDYLEKNFPEKMSYDQLRIAVKEAWEKVPEDWLLELVQSMPDRVQAVIAANGLYTRY
jgi:hypothetical protein